MDMKAITLRFGTGEAAVAAIAAGCDGVLHVRRLDQEPRSPRSKASFAPSRTRRCRSRASTMRWRAMPREGPLPVGGARRRCTGGAALRDVIGLAEHQAVAEQMRQFA